MKAETMKYTRLEGSTVHGARSLQLHEGRSELSQLSRSMSLPCRTSGPPIATLCIAPTCASKQRDLLRRVKSYSAAFGSFFWRVLEAPGRFWNGQEGVVLFSLKRQNILFGDQPLLADTLVPSLRGKVAFKETLILGSGLWNLARGRKGPPLTVARWACDADVRRMSRYHWYQDAAVR